MAKTHLSLSLFLIGFLLVLFVADIGYVCGQGCDLLLLVEVGECRQCDDYCRSASPVLVGHTVCLYPRAVGQFCMCCR
ncbi:hypothetical protein MKW94_012233 [Papaver nudicaule]|uniref:Uncharacterized protein n=1 Tax=Papaver nudicaule TaxID=74823 RepID=A0AA41VGN6_PAPNU|nr:hypothetical protein [Papaver nudicaule]